LGWVGSVIASRLVMIFFAVKGAPGSGVGFCANGDDDVIGGDILPCRRWSTFTLWGP
jgi:hypothetical protein